MCYPTEVSRSCHPAIRGYPPRMDSVRPTVRAVISAAHGETISAVPRTSAGLLGG
jgi:hypothetical protein